MPNNDKWFDAFFRAVTSSPEFKSVVEKDWVWDMKKWFDKMWDEIKKATTITSSFEDSFATPEAIEAGQSYERKDYTPQDYTPSYMNRTMKKDDWKSNVEVKYFENTNPETWWFKWVAWMQDLKENLKENFIKPLKFKFLVQKITPSSDNLTPSPRSSGVPLNKGKNNGKIVENSQRKARVYKKIHEAYEKFGVSIPTWLLFYWPPWTGKTFVTKKLAQELWAWMIKKSMWEFWSSYIHWTTQNIKNFFDAAKKESEKWPIILFLDEIDSLVSKRTNNVDANKAEEVSQFLQEFNALEEAPNLIVIAATNRPDHLDSAILRSWRFDKKFYIWAPDFNARKELFHIYIEKESKPHKKLDYDKLAKLTEWYVAADIEAICDEVSRDASSSILDLINQEWIENLDDFALEDKLDDNYITQELLEKAIAETTSSLKYVDMKIYEEWLKEEKNEINNKEKIERV